jgi:hypothetical protein
MAFTYLNDLQRLFLMVSIRTRVAAHSAAMGKSLPQAGRKWLMDNLGLRHISLNRTPLHPPSLKCR